MSRFLAVDYGSKRIGLAIGDDDTYFASPIKTIAGCHGQARQGLPV